MAKKAPGKPEFPRQVFVKREHDANDPDSNYLLADETTDSFEDGDQVAIYELREVKTKRVAHSLE